MICKAEGVVSQPTIEHKFEPYTAEEIDEAIWFCAITATNPPDFNRNLREISRRAQIIAYSSFHLVRGASTCDLGYPGPDHVTDAWAETEALLRDLIHILR